MTQVTEKQEKLLKYLEEEVERSGRTPSLRQAAAYMGVSHAAVSQLIKTLERKGLVKREGRYSRKIFILKSPGRYMGTMPSMKVPVVGTIAAGLPLYAQQEWEGAIVVDSSIYQGRTNIFALRVKGDSMKNAAILDGDLVICEPRQFAANGEIVAVLVNGEEATVKRFFLRKKCIELRPENPDFKPMKYDFSQVLVQGRVIGVHRGPDVMERL